VNATLCTAVEGFRLEVTEVVVGVRSIWVSAMEALLTKFTSPS